LRPSLRSFLIGLLVLGLAGGAYVSARQTSLFGLETIEIRGVSGPFAGRVRQRLAPLLGSSLVSLDVAGATLRVRALPEVAGVSLDRDFPHTLRIYVRLDSPVAILRQASSAWLLSARGRVLRRVTRPYPPLPRVWARVSVPIAVEQILTGPERESSAALGAVSRSALAGLVRAAAMTPAGVVLALPSGRRILLGDLTQLPLKLAVAARILPLAGEAHYLDVSVPERPVAGSQPQV
jgi:cell division protein FtsQ